MNARCNPIPAHPALFTSVRWPKAAAPKRTAILDLIEKLVPWDALEQLARPVYQSDIQKKGRKGYSLAMMLRCLVLQQFWLMSDRQTEAAILDSHAMAKFIGTDPWAPRPPSASAIRAFRDRLVAGSGQHADALAEIHLAVTLALIDAGFEFRQGELREPVFRQRAGSDK